METFNVIETNARENQYAFRFVSSNQLVYLTQQQIDLIPYLSVLLAHKDDFLSIENENGEYLLNDPIEYHSFLAILHSITLNNPYILLEQLPESVNILETLRLFDYLGLQSFPLPFLKDTNLIQSNPDQNEHKKQRVTYSKLTLSETRQTAAQFVIGLAENQYQLDDLNTSENIFNLINIILSHATVFSSSFRCHTLTITRKCCYSFFSKDEKRQLRVTHRITQNRKSNLSTYLSDDNQSLPEYFENSFTWKQVPLPIEEDSTDRVRSNSTDMFYVDFPDSFSPFNNNISLYAYTLPILCWRYWPLNPIIQIRSDADTQVSSEQVKQVRKEEEAQSARSGYFNTMPKRPKVDKFKHRCGPKAQKYR